jgi:hypothetical protein
MREYQLQFPPLRCKHPWGCAAVGESQGKNGRDSPGFFLLPVCTDAESPEQFRARSRKTFSVFPFGVSVGGRLLVAAK